MRAARRLAELGLAALLVFAAYWALRLAWADYQFRSGTSEGAARAAHWVPFRAEYQAAAGNWKRAVELNPYFSKGWIQLALEAEAAGDRREAERLLLEAARVDKLFEPRWALANFYARQANQAEFWKWARLAAERSYGDRTGLFRLSQRVTKDPLEIASRIFPADPVLRREFASFLATEGALDGAAAIARSLPLETGDAFRLDLTDRLIHAGRFEQARALWPASAVALTNGNLETAPSSKAFDWRLHWRSGVNTTWSPGRLRIELNGKQPEAVDLVSQYVWIDEPGVYRFSYRYRSEEIAKESGLYWTVFGAETAAPRKSLHHDGWIGESLEFRTGKPREIVRLELRYERRQGTVRAEGILWLEGPMKLERAAVAVTTLK